MSTNETYHLYRRWKLFSDERNLGANYHFYNVSGAIINAKEDRGNDGRLPVLRKNATYPSVDGTTIFGHNVSIDEFILIACLIVLAAILLFSLLFSLWRLKFRRGKRRRKNGLETRKPSHSISSNKVDIYPSCTIARIDEFDTLTPLMITPSVNLFENRNVCLAAASTSKEEVPSYSTNSSKSSNATTTTTTTKSTVRQQHYLTPNSRQSPKFRRPTSAQMTLIPLAPRPRKNDYSLAACLAQAEDTYPTLLKYNTALGQMAPIDEVTSCGRESSERSSCSSNFYALNGSTPRADVNAKNVFEDLDLVSIDRTSFYSTDQKSPAAPWNVAASAYSTSILNKDLPIARSNLQDIDLMSPTGSGFNYLEILPPLISSMINKNNKNRTVESVQVHSADKVSPFIKTSHSLNSLSRTLMLLNNNNGDHGHKALRATGSLNNAVTSLSNNRLHKHQSTLSSPEEPCSLNMSSPMESMGDTTGSPLDTSGSTAELSDRSSLYMASESDLSEMAKGVMSRTFPLEPLSGNGQQATTSGNNNNNEQNYNETSFFEYETPAGKRYLLHRIEEESEDNERSRCDRSSSNHSNVMQSGSKFTRKYFL